ncbi:BH3-interacting domain death agonist [Nothoprocta perdicaria]|uniref:BH3-interacting domain death agonist n=1 Tax=Nothoprocta perdicaria TaxID=30464 RepID=UPI000E1C2890|nr:BH3-interacting domain death agonist [Nothoprocta perdicaria]
MEQDIHSNGSRRMEGILLYNFLQSSSNCEFRDQLQALRGQWLLPAVKPVCHYEDDGDLQTDGNRSGHLQNGELALANEGLRDEEIFRIIGAQLAEIGDQLDKEIQARVVNDLVQHFLNENLSREEITRCLSQAVEGLARAIPSDMEQEKALLVLAMVLTKKVANRVPSLLHRIFSTTVNYINQHLHAYVVRMLRE